MDGKRFKMDDGSAFTDNVAIIARMVRNMTSSFDVMDSIRIILLIRDIIPYQFTITYLFLAGARLQCSTGGGASTRPPHILRSNHPGMKIQAALEYDRPIQVIQHNQHRVLFVGAPPPTNYPASILPQQSNDGAYTFDNRIRKYYAAAARKAKRIR